VSEEVGTVLVELSVVEQRFAAVLEVIRDGLAVVDVADRYGVSRQSIYAWFARYEAGGLAGLADRSHRPARCPHQLASEVEARSVSCGGCIRRAIADGEANPGERLPPAKDLAAVLGVNANTVFRALRLLRDEGFLEFRRGRGVSVVGTPEQGAVVSKARELVEYARRHGYKVDELIHIIKSVT
jgi:GntR family transcriptional regulator